MVTWVLELLSLEPLLAVPEQQSLERRSLAWELVLGSLVRRLEGLELRSPVPL
jgi:hypothetical protein